MLERKNQLGLLLSLEIATLHLLLFLNKNVAICLLALLSGMYNSYLGKASREGVNMVAGKSNVQKL
jgi:hypothetical protein